jgi:hypothetical protein
MRWTACGVLGEVAEFMMVGPIVDADGFHTIAANVLA